VNPARVGALLGALTASLAALAGAAVLFHLAYTAWVRRRFPTPDAAVAWGGGALRLVRRGAGPPVLLVHGMNGTAHDFPDALLDDLARDHTVLALNRPGHGDSARGTRTLDLATNADALRAALGAARGERTVLVGHSYGAAVALRAALDAPESVAGVVLLTPCTVVDARNRAYAELPVPPGFARRFALWVGTVPVGLWVSRRTRREAWHPAPAPPGFPYSRAWALVPAQLEAALENFHTLPADLAALAAELPRLAAPVTVLAGDRDVITPWRTHAEWLPRAVPHATVRVIEGTGHWLMRQRPDLVAAAVREAGARG
jgi:pimeloyl-ACP methyl ester carboxylesterase